MTSDLSARLSDPTPSLTLSDRLSDPNRLTLADHLGIEDYMEVNLAPEATLMGNPIIPQGQLTRNMLDANTPYQHTAMRDSTPIHDTTDDEAMDEPKEGELVCKKTKRGRCSGHKI